MEGILYPTNDFGPVMKGLAIGGLGIFHVFTAHFAIGGGILLCYMQWLTMTGRCKPARTFIDGFFRFLVLVSFVTGALTGVAMWFTSIQVSPVTIGIMVDEFHWLWAIEWTFFCLEVVSGYAAYRYIGRLSDRGLMTLLVLYSFAAWMSLFWINGILSFQLTPGRWLESHNIWHGFFNPTFLPSLLYRTIAAMVVASLVSMVTINFSSVFDREQKTDLIHRVAWLMAPMVVMPFVGVWFVAAMPPDSRAWIMGGSIAMTLMLHISVAASSIIGVYALVGLLRHKLFINGATALLLCVMAFAATAGGEFVREGVRKPFTLRQVLYSNSIRPEQVAQLRLKGLTSLDPYPLREEATLPVVDGKPDATLHRGALVFRQQCSICHTLGGVNDLLHLTHGWDADMKRQNFAKLQQLKPFMPPFAGTSLELESLVQFIGWHEDGKPPKWPMEGADDLKNTIARIDRWLDEAGPISPSVQSMPPADKGVSP